MAEAAWSHCIDKAGLRECLIAKGDEDAAQQVDALTASVEAKRIA